MSLKQRLLPGATAIGRLWSFFTLGPLWKEWAVGSDGRAGSRSSLTLWGISEKGG